MILIFDIGNTNITAAVFRGEELVFHFRLRTGTGYTEDQYYASIKTLLEKNTVAPSDIGGCMVGSVVPDVTAVIARMVEKYFSLKPVLLTPKTKLNITNMYKNKSEVGDDRIANAVQARRQFGKTDAVVIDFGTAITFDVLNKKGQYLGGTIMPGINLTLSTLSSRTAKLPQVEMGFPDRTIGNTTAMAMQSGMANLIAGGVNYTLENIKKELKAKKVKVILTGGEATKDIQARIREKGSVLDHLLTLKGFKYIYDLNGQKAKKK